MDEAISSTFRQAPRRGAGLTSRKRGFAYMVLSVAHEDPINSIASLSAPSRLINEFAGAGQPRAAFKHKDLATVVSPDIRAQLDRKLREASPTSSVLI